MKKIRNSLWLITALLMLNACSSSPKFLGYNIWGGYSSYRQSSVRVTKGETLYSIARQNDVPIRDVIDANNFRPPYILKVGQIVKLPQAKYHIVEKGDTLYSISKMYNVDMPSLSKTNDLRAPFTLKIGQKLLMPGSIVTKQNNNFTYKKQSNYKPKTYASNSKIYNYPKAHASRKRKNKFLWPVKGQVVSKFGPVAKGRNNDGINIKAAKGSNIKAADSGVVAYAGNELRGFGNLILIKHYDGWVSAYAHADKIKVKRGQKIERGQIIATVGNSGGVNTPQLHFEVRAGKKAVNPLFYL